MDKLKSKEDKYKEIYEKVSAPKVAAVDKEAKITKAERDKDLESAVFRKEAKAMF